MAEPKLIKFNKDKPEHVQAIKSEDVKIHSGGYFSKNVPSPKKSESTPAGSTVAKKVATPRKLKPVPTAKPTAEKKEAVKKAPAKKAAVKKKQFLVLVLAHEQRRY